MKKVKNTCKFSSLFQQDILRNGIGFLRSPVREGLSVPRLNFKPFHVAISEGSHAAVGISASGLSFVVISAPSCRRFRAVSPVGISLNSASFKRLKSCIIYTVST